MKKTHGGSCNRVEHLMMEFQRSAHTHEEEQVRTEESDCKRSSREQSKHCDTDITWCVEPIMVHGLVRNARECCVDRRCPELGINVFFKIYPVENKKILIDKYKTN